jgi:hypothetical protein
MNSYMRNVTIQFPSLQELWKFRLAVNANACEIKQRNIITCMCSDEDIDQAVNRFGANILSDVSRNEVADWRFSCKS